MGDATTLSEAAPDDHRRAPTRRRAVGTRDRIIGHLALITEISDPAGMASARLATAVGYPGTSVAFAQLLSGMERDGLITREVRGKRTYRITLSTPLPAAVPLPVRAVPEPDAAPPDPADSSHAACSVTIDYDDLANRVLIQLIRRLSELSAAELASLERLLVRPADPPSSATA